MLLGFGRALRSDIDSAESLRRARTQLDPTCSDVRHWRMPFRLFQKLLLGRTPKHNLRSILQRHDTISAITGIISQANRPNPTPTRKNPDVIHGSRKHDVRLREIITSKGYSGRATLEISENTRNMRNEPRDAVGSVRQVPAVSKQARREESLTIG